MEITNKEQNFLVKRAKFIQFWPVVGSVLLCLMFGLGTWLIFSRPLLVNPFYVLSELKKNSIPESTMVLMAGLLPVAVLMCLILTLVLLIFVFVALNNEKKHISVIQRLLDSSGKGQLDGT